MNRYLIVDFEDKCISSLNKIETDFEINEIQTSSISCIDKEDLIKELEQIVKELKESLRDDKNE
jgi:predicted NACHT family NTPase